MVNCGTRQAGTTYYEITKIYNRLSPYEIKCIEDMKYLVNKLCDKDLEILFMLLLGNRYEEFIDMVKRKNENRNI